VLSPFRSSKSTANGAWLCVASGHFVLKQGNDWQAMLGIGALAAVARLIPGVLFFGTSDVMGWDLLARQMLAGENFFATQLHNWPVLWIYFAVAAVVTGEAAGLPFAPLVKLGPIAADVALALMLCRAAGPGAGLIYALHPIPILIAGYHGQFDSLMLAPTFLAWRLFERRKVVGSALALGLGVWFKPVPLILLPILLPRLDTWRQRSIYVVLCLAPAALGTLPYLLRWPEDVIANFFNYSSWFGQWGYPVLWMLVEYVRDHTIPVWLPDPDFVSPPLQAMFAFGRWVLLATLTLVWIVTFRRRLSVLRSTIALLCAFYFTTVGFGLQYLLWVVPFAIAARDRMLWPYTVATTALLLTAYLLGAAYLAPEGLLDIAEPDTREFLVKLATLPTWLLCGAWALASLTTRRPATERSPRAAPAAAASPATATESR
jgi:hypothetical protein